MKIKQCNEFYYRVEVDDNIQLICQKFNTSKENILRNNNNLALYAGEWVIIKQNEFKTHIVKPMETLSSICKIYNVDKEKLKTDNNLETEKLYIGQCIKIY